MTAIPSRFLPLGRLLVFSPLGLSFLDDYTGQYPIGFLKPTLEVETPPGSGAWAATGVRGLFTNTGILAYPNLGRRGRVPSPPEAPRNYRVLITSQYYEPLYPGGPGSLGVVFPVTPYDEATDFKVLKPTRVILTLVPRANYPFEGGTSFLKGQVLKASGGSVVALLTAVEPIDATGDMKQTRVLTDPEGFFRLPLRWGDPAATTSVTATDPASGKSKTISLSFPYDLTNPQTITIPNL
jgi:hypothetical protein